MTVKLVFPHWVNDQHVPTVREFYMNLIECLSSEEVDYDIVPDYRRMSIRSPTRIEKIIPDLEIRGDYEKEESYDHIISYHTCNPDHINVKISYLPNYFYFDEKGYAGWSEIAESEPNYNVMNTTSVDEEFNNIKEKIVGNNISKYQQPDQDTRIKIPTPYVFLPTQVEDDEVSKLAYVETYDLLKKCISEIPETNYHLVIKRHPRCDSDRVTELLSRASTNSQIHIVDRSIHDLIENAAAVVTVNSGVGFEALLHEKPVINFGQTDYHWATTTFEEQSKVSEITDVIEKFDSKDETAIRKFVVYFLENYLVNLNNEDSYIRAFDRVGII
ncbi:hypothetical protein GLW36_01345 [Halorubrum terrestre]|uniref:Capsular biosynthesis protein n=1 Tax=Halorubrum distributum TaxID=29283 RepID=A0A6B1IAQ3_9EURY|nr:hypothetical protein [Halorubrum terrestre]MYL15296.1 hypothetical protein [Halorubrum terrestre]